MLKDPGFCWLGNDYDKCKRTQGPDREGMDKYAGALDKLLQVVGYGLPRHTPIKDTLRASHAKHGIAGEPGSYHWADEAAQKLTMMVKHLHNDAKSKRRYITSDGDAVHGMRMKMEKNTLRSACRRTVKCLMTA